MPSLFAFLHHIAAFSLVAALAVEFVVIKGELNVANIRKLAVADAIFGVSAGTILIVGFIRVFYFEKGATYYFYSLPFIVKLALFIVVGLLSIYPTLQFLSWRKSAQQSPLLAVAPPKQRAIRILIHIELMAVVLLILCAALMARGVGHIA